jgi:hypothetical protein
VFSGLPPPDSRPPTARVIPRRVTPGGSPQEGHPRRVTQEGATPGAPGRSDGQAVTPVTRLTYVNEGGQAVIGNVRSARVMRGGFGGRGRAWCAETTSGALLWERLAQREVTDRPASPKERRPVSPLSGLGQPREADLEDLRELLGCVSISSHLAGPGEE